MLNIKNTKIKLLEGFILLLTDVEKEEMAKENYSLVYYVVQMFRNTNIDMDELVSIATVGYAKALNSYDTEREVKFSTYAINCIRNEILFFLRKEKNHLQKNISMNLILSTDKNGNELSIGDTLTNEENRDISVEKQVVLLDDIAKLREAMNDLTENERFIMTYRFGLDNGEIKTQREISEIIGMSQANVSKIEKNVLIKVRKILTQKYNVSGESYM